MRKSSFQRKICLIAVLALFSISSIAQQVGVSDISFTPQSLLHLHSSGSGAAKLFQITNGVSGNGSSSVGFTFDVDASFNISMNNHQGTSLGFNTNGSVRMTISSTGLVGINVAPASNMLYVQSTSDSYNAIFGEHVSATVGSNYSAVSGKLNNAAYTISQSYLGYHTSGNKTFSVYSTGGDWAGVFTNKFLLINDYTTITAANTGDFEIQNLTAGANNPATLTLRQSTQTTVTGNLIGNINFGTSYQANPQAQIQVLRDAASSNSSDLPTAMAFSTIPDGSTVLTERMRITNGGNVGIGTSTPDASAALDIGGTTTYNRGLLIPRASLNSTTDVLTIPSPATYTLVFNTNAGMTGGNKGLYWYNGTKWEAFLDNISPNAGWMLTGNAGTTPGTNFMGTTDDNDVVFKRNNAQSGLLNSASGLTFWGYQAGVSTTGTYNSAFGYQALFTNTTGANNTAHGYQALYSNNATDNSAVGYQALYTNTTGANNVANGYQALYLNNGTGNIAIGCSALYNNTGSYNTAVGYNALINNTSGAINTATGEQALLLNTTGSNNTAFGGVALYFNTTGSNNTATGFGALYKNTGNSNTANGQKALYNNTTGSFNTATGDSALFLNTTGTVNTAIGYEALQANTTGIYNTAVGAGAMMNGSTAVQNTAVGVNSLYYGSGTNNTAVGCYAALGVAGSSTGINNTALGVQALQGYTTGYNNAAIGANALYNNSTGYDNVAVGREALDTNVSGSYNTAIGTLALYESTGSSNTAVGMDANIYFRGTGNTAIGMYSLEGGAPPSGNTGGYNTAVGYAAGSGYNSGSPNNLQITSGDHNTFLGYSSSASANNFTNATAIGAYSEVGESNALVLGSISGTNNAPATTNVGIGTMTPSSILDVRGSVSGCASSDWGILTIGDNSAGQNGLTFGFDGTNNWAWLFARTTGCCKRPININNSAYIQYNGFVGIGNSSPASMLDVYSWFGSGSNPGTVSASNSIIAIDWGGATNAIAYTGQVKGTLNWQLITNGIVYFANSPSLVANQTISSAYGLYISNQTTAGVSVGYGLFQAGTSDYNYFGGAVSLGKLAGVGNRAVYSDPSGYLTNTSSDIRLKKNIETISGKIDVIKSLRKLRGVYYNWNTDIGAAKNLGNQKEIGMIAQEVEQVLPELVGTNSTGYKSLDYPKITGFLIEVNKVQQGMIDSLKFNVQSLHSAVNSLQTEIENLKAQNTSLSAKFISQQAEIEKIKQQLGMEAKK